MPGVRVGPLLLLFAVTLLFGLRITVTILPPPQDHFMRQERMWLDGNVFSPQTVFIKLEEQNNTNNPPTSIALTSRDYVRQLPDSLGRLSHLTDIRIENQPIQELPASIGALNNLRSLIIINTPITSLPETLGNLTNLENLEIVGTKVRQLPHSIGSLTNLKALTLAYNDLGRLPPTISQLSNVVELDVTGNNLTRIPDPLPPSLLRFFFVGGNHIPAAQLKALDAIRSVYF